MSEKYLKECLERLGWGSGFYLPVANDENRELEKQLEAQQRKVAELRTSLDEMNRCTQDLKDSSSRITVLMTNTAKMGLTNRGTLEHTRSLNAAAENAQRNIRRDYKAKEKELREQQQRHAKIRLELDKRQEVVNQLSAEIEWDKSIIETVRNSSKDDESDIELMEKYFKMDENAIKERESAYMKVKNRSHKLKSQLERIWFETKSAEETLGRVTDQFRQVHKSRNDAVQLWKGVIDSLKLRDADLKKLSEQYVMLKEKLRAVSEIATEKNSLLKTTQHNLGELERHLHSLEKSTSALRQRISANESSVKQYVNELSVTRQEIQSLCAQAKELQNQKTACETELRAIADKESELRTELETVRKEYKTFKYGSSSIDEKFREMESMLDAEEEVLRCKEKELDNQKTILIQATNQSVELKHAQLSLSSDLKQKYAVIQNIARIRKLNGRKIQERNRAYYKLEQKDCRLQHQIDKLMQIKEESMIPKLSPEDLEKLRIQCQQTLIYKVKQENLHSFTASVLFCIKKELDQYKEAGTAIQVRSNNLYNLVDAFKREGVNRTKALHQIKFQFQMTLLTRSRLIKAIKRRKEQAFSAGKNCMQLEAVAGGRRAEIQTHLVLLQNQKRALMGTRAKLVLNLKESRVFINTWKTKYEFIMTSMGDGSESEASSEAFLIVKLAQEREMLKREGEVWDCRVKEAETEVEGLQNTLALISKSNQCFQASLEPKRKSTAAKKTIMTDKLLLDFTILKKQADEHMANLNDVAKEKIRELHELEFGIQFLRNSLADRRQELNAVIQEINGQKSKIDRSELLIRRLLKQMRQFEPEEKNLIESEIRARCLREKYKFAIKTIQKTIVTFPNLLPLILEYVQSNTAFTKLAGELEKLKCQVQAQLTRTRMISSMMPTHVGTCLIPTRAESSFMPTRAKSSMMSTRAESSMMPTRAESSMTPTRAKSSMMPTRAESSMMPTTRAEHESSMMPARAKSSMMPNRTGSTIKPTRSKSTTSRTTGQTMTTTPNQRYLTYHP